MLSLLLVTLVTTLNLFPARGLGWDPTGPHSAPTGPSLTFDPKVRFLDAGPATGSALKVDSRIKFIDTNFNGIWDPGETVVYDLSNSSRYDVRDPVIAGNTPSSVSTILNADPKLKFVDINFDAIWDLGEAVVYDSNNNNVYDSGEPVLAGTTPVFGTAEIFDSHVKFVDSTGTGVWNPGKSVIYDSNGDGLYSASVDPRIKFVDLNGNGVWDSSKPVVYDTNNNNIYDTGDIVIYGSPVLGAALKVDSHIKFVDMDRNGVWRSGEAVVYDTNNGGIVVSGTPVIAQAAPVNQTVLSVDSRIKFWDKIGNGLWAPGDTVVYDDMQRGNYSATIDPKIMFYNSSGTRNWVSPEAVIYDKDGDGWLNFGDIVIFGSAPPQIDWPVPLSKDIHFRFVDTNRSGVWVNGEAVTYETDTNNIYDAGEIIVIGTVQPGTLLSEPIITGPVPVIGTLLKVDPKVKYVDPDKNQQWDPGEPVVYDSNANGVYDTGEPLIVGTNPPVGTLLSEPVIAGPTPAIGTLLKVDPKVKIIDPDSNGLWDPGEVVSYDANNNSIYDLGEPIVAAAAPADGVWDPGEPVTYDANNNGKYDSGEIIVAGATPANNTTLRGDTHIRFIDSNLSNRWEPGKTVIYDTDSNNLYEVGEPIIAGLAPQPKLAFAPSLAPDPLGRVWLAWNEKPGGTMNPNVFFRMWNGSYWTSKQQVTSDNSINNFDFITPLVNQTMILWSSNKTGHPQLFYRLYANNVVNPYPTTTAIQLTSGPMSDVSPSAIQDRSGRTWVAWARQNANKTTSSIYYKYFNGTSWSPDFALPGASSTTLFQNSPSITQTKDGRIWIVFSSNDSLNANLYYTRTDGTILTLPSTGIPAGSWTTKNRLFSSSDEDDRPSIIQARDGTIMIFYQKSVLSGAEYIYSGYSADNGATWVGGTAFSTGTDDSPTSAQMADRRIWVVWNRQNPTLGTQQLQYTTSDQILNIHDLGVRGLTATPSLVMSGDKFNVTVTIVNYGDFLENTTLTLKLNNTVISTTSQSLSAGQSRLVLFTYQTVSPVYGRYTVSASIPAVTGENIINQADDSMSAGPQRVSPPGDVDRDGNVNILDAALIAFAYGSRPGDPKWNPAYDITHDGVIDILDAAILAYYYGRSV
jgi:hypothetical protein